MEDKNPYNEKLFEDIENIKRALQFYISENLQLKTDLDYYRNAYENRVDDFINRDRFE